MGSEIIPPGEATPAEIEEQFTRRFTSAYRRGVESIVEAGQVLIECQEHFGRGQWQLWVEFSTPVSIRTAQQLMRIAADPNIRRMVSNADHAKHVSHLPQDRNTLLEICGMEEERFDGLVEAGTIHAEMRRGDVRRALVDQSHGGSAPSLDELPDGKYRSILADPPWAFETHGPHGKGRSPENHYPVMSATDIINLNVMQCLADDCALFLWVTSENLKWAPAVMASWGFELVSTAFVWVKDGHPGLGYWTRKGSEICLLGKRGSPKRLAKDVAEVIHAPRGRHSEKPAEVYERIERLVPGPYLELFAREPREGWDAWGNDPALEPSE